MNCSVVCIYAWAFSDEWKNNVVLHVLTCTYRTCRPIVTEEKTGYYEILIFTFSDYTMTLTKHVLCVDSHCIRTRF